MDHPTESLDAYQAAIRNNPHSVPSLKACADIYRKHETREGYTKVRLLLRALTLSLRRLLGPAISRRPRPGLLVPQAVEFLQRVLNVEPNDGDAWGWLGYCYLMVDDVPKAFTAYQQALYLMPSPQDPYLWYGLGILYERYNSYDQAEGYFNTALRHSKDFEKKDDIQYRLGIIHKQQKKYDASLKAFNAVLDSQAAIEQKQRAAWVGQPHQSLVQACTKRQLSAEGESSVLVERLVRLECEKDRAYYSSKAGLWYQVGHVRELTQDYHAAKEAYERVLEENNTHARALQQLGWLYHNIPNFSAEPSASGGGNQEIAVKYLLRSIESNPADDQAWYLLGRCYMTQREYTMAHKAYEKAVNINDRDPTYWCSIGVLYYYNQQYHDALDTYSRALQLNPELSEIWYNLGILYECCNQVTDAVDAYTTAAALDASNQKIKSRLTVLKRAQRQQSAGSGAQGGGAQGQQAKPPEAAQAAASAASASGAAAQPSSSSAPAAAAASSGGSNGTAPEATPSEAAAQGDPKRRKVEPEEAQKTQEAAAAAST